MADANPEWGIGPDLGLQGDAVAVPLAAGDELAPALREELETSETLPPDMGPATEPAVRDDEHRLSLPAEEGELPIEDDGEPIEPPRIP